MNGRVFMILVMHMMKVDFNSTQECGCKFEIFDRATSLKKSKSEASVLRIPLYVKL